MPDDLVSIVLVNWNGGPRLADCLGRLPQQSYRPLEIVVVDNGSTDGSLVGLPAGELPTQIIRNGYNAGFSRAANQGIAAAAGEYLLSLNADVWVEPQFVAQLVHAIETSPQAGMACGKLLSGAGPSAGRRLDSTGLFLSRTRRPYDRGLGEEDRRQYDAQVDVFGACGAAWLCRRAMLADVAVAGEVLDEDFFVYYEDADLSWRAQLRGWRCRYAPQAIAWHERGSGDLLRRASNAPKRTFAQAHALKNRYLMMLKNDEWANLLPALPALLAGDLARLAWMAARRPALLRAYRDAWRLRRRALAKRRIIQAGRRASAAEIRMWLQ